MADWGTIRQSAARLAVIDGLAVSASWGNTAISGTRSTLRREDVATDEGLLAYRYRFSLLCPCSQFAATGYPAPRTDKITVGGTSYRVISCEEDAAGAMVRINLGDELA